MVETQQDSADDNQDYGQLEDEDGDLPVYLTSDYLNQIYQSGESNDDSDVRTPSNLSNYSASRPLSRYSKDFEDFDVMKSQHLSNGNLTDRILDPFIVN